MRTTIDLPDSLYRRTKAEAARQGVKLRELFAVALERFLQAEDRSTNPRSAEIPCAVPKVPAVEIEKYPDADALVRAFPDGYRIVGPLIPATGDSSPIRADQVAEEAPRMDREEVEGHGRTG